MRRGGVLQSVIPLAERFALVSFSEKLDNAIRPRAGEWVGEGHARLVRILAVESGHGPEDLLPLAAVGARPGNPVSGSGLGVRGPGEALLGVVADQERTLGAVLVLRERVVRVQDRRVAQDVEVKCGALDLPLLLAEFLPAGDELLSEVVGDVEREVAPHDGDARRGSERAGARVGALLIYHCC